MPNKEPMSINRKGSTATNIRLMKADRTIKITIKRNNCLNNKKERSQRNKPKSYFIKSKRNNKKRLSKLEREFRLP